jgi:AbrB family looped-hinge helix DNA binding protein
MYISTVTKQGQISIPAKLRKKLNIDKKKVMISEETGKIIIEPIKDLLDLAGSLRTTKKPLSNKQLDEFVAEVVVEEYAKKMK